MRLALYYVLGCALVVAGGLLWRATLEAGAGLNRTLPPTGAPGMDVPFAGVTVELAGRPSDALATRLAELREAGFGWVRQRFDWREIEPAPGEFDWAQTDRLVDAISQAGLAPVAVLDGAPDWALAPADRAAQNGLAPPANFADFARFAAAFADRYGEDVRFYQIWDEPNIAPHWGNRLIEPVHYARLLKDAAAAIRAADADAVI
ncbi:MAG: beta-galactosidase, partial [Caldilineaceae bacterium]|nr:beta-galactosidase [Caldilineaceae bacterium]